MKKYAIIPAFILMLMLGTLHNILYGKNTSSCISQYIQQKNASVSSAELVRTIITVTMHVWTQLDLVGAIRSSHEDLIYFADSIINHILDIRELLILLEHAHLQQPLSYADKEYLLGILHQIYERFDDVFSTLYSKEVFCAAVLIEKILTQLEQLN